MQEALNPQPWTERRSRNKETLLTSITPAPQLTSFRAVFGRVTTDTSPQASVAGFAGLSAEFSGGWSVQGYSVGLFVGVFCGWALPGQDQGVTPGEEARRMVDVKLTTPH